jgi:hypothetical protein
LPVAIEESGTMFVLKARASSASAHERLLTPLSQGWHMWKESDMSATMELADVIVVNYGLHYLVRRRTRPRSLHGIC